MKSTASGLTSYGNFFEQIWWLRPPLGQKGGLRPASARRDGSSRQSRRRRGAGATGSKTGRAFRWMGTLVVLCVVAKLLIFSAEKQTQLREEEEEEDDCAGRMAARLELVNRVCADDPRAAPLRRGGRDDNYPIPHFFRSNAHHRATVCTPHKCGSESWRYFFERLDERDRNSSEWRSSVLKEWPEDVADFVKAFQVRHPLERALSSFRYVFEQTNLHLTDDLAATILERFTDYRRPPGRGRIFPDRNVTFRQFVRFLTHQELFNEAVTQRSASSHWRPFHLQCNPCHPEFRPDFLIHLETAPEDTECFLAAVDGIVEEDYDKLYLVNRHPDGHSSEEAIRRSYFSTLSKGDVVALAEFYGLDMDMHGYDAKEYVEMAKVQESDQYLSGNDIFLED